jgi:hypothetical protein
MVDFAVFYGRSDGVKRFGTAEPPRAPQQG